MSSITAGDIESPPLSAYSPLLSPEESAPPTWRKPVFVSLALMLLMLSGLAAFIFILGTDVTGLDPLHREPIVMDRGVKAGVSMKGSGLGMLREDSYPWNNNMLSWQRSGFHFQPKNNWMNDPNGPMYYKGLYHFFYQYNPDAAVWGNIAWGHAVSKDLINWVHLDLALVRGPDGSYDHDGVWSGSATVLPDGRVIMIYTGLLNGTQVQNIAKPRNLSDPLLRDWIKLDEINPVMNPPRGIGADDFRDPSTAWFERSDSTWRVTIGAKDAVHNGIALVYSTKDFETFTLHPKPLLHKVEKVGMWECIDFYPIAVNEIGANRGLNTSEGPSPVTKHVLKASTQDNGKDYYAIGTYDPVANTWVPDNESLDVGLGLRYDWGNFYASKTFYDDANKTDEANNTDEAKQRRILWGWVKEADSERADTQKGWAGLQGIPRTVLFDLKTKTHLLTWPVEEVESLRTDLKDFTKNITALPPGSKLPLISDAAQLDIEVEFNITKEALDSVQGQDVEYECESGGGAAQSGPLGPFGLLVLAKDDFTEQTATYFYISKKSDGSFVTHFCQDESRSSKASDTRKIIVGHTVPVLPGESFKLRVLVDHSIVESFAQGGRASATSRVYPTEAINDDACLYVFSNATGASITVSSLKVWRMKSAEIKLMDF